MRAPQTSAWRLGSPEPTPGERDLHTQPSSPPVQGRAPKLFARGWVATLPLVLMVASDYDFRLRAADESLSGRPDAAIVFEIAVYAAVTAFMLVFIGRPPRWRRSSKLLFATWGFGVSMMMTAFYAIYPVLAMVRGIQLLVVCGLAQVITRHASRLQLHRLAHAYVVLVSVSVVAGLALPFARSPIRANRFNWLYVHPVVTGTYLGLATIILFGYLIIRRRQQEAAFGRQQQAPLWPWRVYACLLAMNATALIATRTRGAIAATVCGCLVTAFMVAPPVRRLDLLVVLPAICLVTGLLFGSQIVTFVERGDSIEQLQTLNTRTDLWGQALDFFKEKPFTGYGLTASRGLFLEATGLGGAHNGFVNVLTDGGLLGIGWWLALLILLARLLSSGVVRRLIVEAPLLLGLLTFLLVSSLTFEGLGTPANVSNIWLFVLVGWAGVIGRDVGQPKGRRARSA